MEQLFGGGILWTLLIGFVAGLLARAIKPGKDALGFFMTILLGIGGALLARFIGSQLGWYGPGDTVGLFASVAGAVLLLVLWGVFTRKSS